METQGSCYTAARTKRVLHGDFSLHRRQELSNGWRAILFNSAGLYLKEWVARFNPDKEDLSWAPVWIRMYSLPEEYWDEESLRDIGNGLGEYIKAAEETKLHKYTSYARIYVFMHLDEALPDGKSLSRWLWMDSIIGLWTCTLSLPQMPCSWTSLQGLLAECQDSIPRSSDMQTQDGFTKVTNHKRSHRKPSNGKKPQPEATSFPSSSNSFEILTNTSEDQPLLLKPRLPPLSASANPPPYGTTTIPSHLKEDHGPPKENRKLSSGKAKDMDVDTPPIHSMSIATAPKDMNQP